MVVWKAAAFTDGTIVVFHIARRRDRSVLAGPEECSMKLAGVFLLFAGWGIVLAALVLLAPALAQDVFVLAGVAVEGLGLALLVRSHLMVPGRRIG
jgi:hypothetical protein